MKSLKSNLFNLLIALFVFAAFQACHTKHLVEKPVGAAPEPEPAKPTSAPVIAAQPKPVDQPKTSGLAAPKPNYNFTNIQFEFDSGVLKTDSYPVLDKAAATMKMDPSVKFVLKGYASIEGTEQHNMELSVDRANSVKAYLVNSGVSINNLVANGYGTKDPIASNDTEQGKVLNRRVEIHLQK